MFRPLRSRYRLLIKRMPKKKAAVAVSRNILEIAWHLIENPDARFTDLDPDWYERRIDPERHTR